MHHTHTNPSIHLTTCSHTHTHECSRVAKEAEAEATEEAERASLDSVVGEGLAVLVRRMLQLMVDKDVKVSREGEGGTYQPAGIFTVSASLEQRT